MRSATDRRCSPATSCPCDAVTTGSLGPFAMWSAFPASDYYGPSAPPRGHRPTTGLPTTTHWVAEGRSRSGSHVTTSRSTGWASSSSPAASPRVRRRHSSWPPHRLHEPASESLPAISTHGMRCVRPTSTRWSWRTLKGVQPLVHFRFASPSRLPARGRLAVPTRLACRGCSRPPLRSRGQAAPSFTGLLRQTEGGVLSSPPDS